MSRGCECSLGIDNTAARYLGLVTHRSMRVRMLPAFGRTPDKPPAPLLRPRLPRPPPRAPLLPLLSSAPPPRDPANASAIAAALSNSPSSAAAATAAAAATVAAVLDRSMVSGRLHTGQVACGTAATPAATGTRQLAAHDFVQYSHTNTHTHTSRHTQCKTRSAYGVHCIALQHV